MEREREERPTAAPVIAPDFLAVLDFNPLLRSAADPDAYGEDLLSGSSAPDSPLDLPTDRQSILVELDLRSGLAPGDLARIRRRFALVNHPDRLPPAFHAQATMRMKIANALIDEAQSRINLSGS